MIRISRGYLQDVRLVCLIVAILMLGPGCALNRQGVEEVTATWERHQARLSSETEAYAPTTPSRRGGSRTRPATQPSEPARGPVRLREYIRLALKNNPDIQQAEQAARAKAARIPQVTALPDPILMTKTLPEPVRTAEGDNYFILGISQKFPVPEKLDRAGRIALEETRMAIAEWDRVRLRVIADVKRAYYRIYILDRTMEVVRENQRLVRGLIEAIRGEVITGKRTQDDILRAQVELAQLDARLIALGQQRTAAEALLNSLLNRAPTVPVPSPEPFTLRSVDVTLHTLLAKAIEVNPELQKLQKQLDRDRQAVALARLAYWPDFTLGFEWMEMEPRAAFQPPPNPQTGRRPQVSKLSEDGSDNWAIVFGFNLPLWYDKITAGIREARRRLSATMQAYTSARNRINARIQDAWADVTAQHELVKLFEHAVIPQARQAYEIARAGYMVGRSDFQYVVDNWQQWLSATIQYHRAMGELERSVADLEEAVGLSLSELEVVSAAGP